MKIANLRLHQVSGTIRPEHDQWEERLIRPVDIYPEHRIDGPRDAEMPLNGRITAIFVELETEDGATGRGGPITPDQAFLIDTQMRSLIVGSDALAHERLWDRLYRDQVHGRGGVAMMAISAIDCARWDLKGRVTNLPVHRVLGGPTRSAIPAYASALGYSLEPKLVAERARAMVAAGYRATKWFFRHGPSDGRAGMDRNEELVATIRDAVGPDVDVMMDAWMSWDVPYTLAMARRLERYRPRWIEEPVMPDKIQSYAAIRRESPIPISGGEHEYTRWGIHRLLAAEAVDVLQPDIYWAGGITEMLKICALASAYDLPVIPHGHSAPASIHLIAAQPEPLTPMAEYLIKWNDVHQFFLARRTEPVNGMIPVPEGPGIGMDLDAAKIEEERDLTWS